MSSKYFTLPLQDSEREVLAHCLGLTQWNFVIVERIRGEVFRATEVALGRVRGFLDESVSHPTYTVDHSGSEAEATKRAGIRLWQEIVPHPFFLLPACPEMSRLWKAFCEFEEALMGCEVSVLRVVSPSASINLLFHYVRSRCVRVGTTHWPREFGTTVRLFEIQTEGANSPAALSELFENTVKNPQSLEILASAAEPTSADIELSF